MEDTKKYGTRTIESKSTEHYYSKILINKSRKAMNLVISGILVTFLTAMLFGHLEASGSWLVMLPPCIAFCVISCFLPKSEEWTYEPWQAKVQQYEQHQLDHWE